MPGGNRKRDFDSMNENDSNRGPPTKRNKQKCTWCDRERERNDLCNRCRQKVESRAKKLLEQKIVGDHHVVKETLEFIRNNVAVSQMRGLDVLQCLEDLFPAKFLLSIFDKQYKGKKGNDVFCCPDRVLRIIIPDMIPTVSSSGISSLNRDALKATVQQRVDSVLKEWQNRDLSSFDATMSRPIPNESTPMNDPPLAVNGQTQPFLRQVALESWSTQNVASFLESCGVRPQLIMQSLRISNSLNISGRKFMELSDEDLRVKWQLPDHSAADILRHRCCYLWCFEQLRQSNLKTMANGVARFPIPLGFHGASYDRLEHQLRLYGLRLIAVTSSYDPMSLVNKIPSSLRFGIDIIVAQGDSHVLSEMIAKFAECHRLPSAALVRHSVQSTGRRRPMLETGSVVSGEFGSESVGMPPEVAMDMDMQPQQSIPPAMKYEAGKNGRISNSALSLSPMSGSSLSPLSDFGGPAPINGMDVDVTTLPPNGFQMPQLQLTGALPPTIPGQMPPSAVGYTRPHGGGGVYGLPAKDNFMNSGTVGFEVPPRQPDPYAAQMYGDATMYSGMASNPNVIQGRGRFATAPLRSQMNLVNPRGYPTGTGWDAYDDSGFPSNPPTLIESASSTDSMVSSSTSVGVAAESAVNNEWQSLLC